MIDPNVLRMILMQYGGLLGMTQQPMGGLLGDTSGKLAPNRGMPYMNNGMSYPTDRTMAVRG